MAIATIATIGGAIGRPYVVSENQAKNAQASPLVSSNEALKTKMLFLLGETERLVKCTFPGMQQDTRFEKLRYLQKTCDLSNQEHVEILLGEMEKLLAQRLKEVVDFYEYYNKMDAKERLEVKNNCGMEVQDFLKRLSNEIDIIGDTLKYVRGNMIRRMTEGVKEATQNNETLLT